MRINYFLNTILDLIYPRRCLLCDDLIEINNKENICSKCSVTKMYLSDNICIKCGKPLDNSSNSMCFDCSKNKHLFTQGRALWEYNHQIKESIYRYKYCNRKDYGPAYAKEMAKFFYKYIDWSIDIVTCVPLHKERLKNRGYNQSEIISRFLGQELKIQTNNKLLKRENNTKPQKDLSDIERINNIEGAFCYNMEYDCSYKNILIIDDIYTTGSTINECSKVLLNNKANNVYFLTLAIGRGL